MFENKEIMMKIRDYINFEYGSIEAFLLLKYLIEHKLARENNGYTTFELSFQIAPSIVLTPKTLVKIETQADGTTREAAEEGLNQLVKRKIVEIDQETNIITLIASMDSICNVFLKRNGQTFTKVPSFEQGRRRLIERQYKTCS